MGKIKALLSAGLSSLCANIKTIRETAESSGSAAAQVAQALADHAGEVEGALNEKQDKLTFDGGTDISTELSGGKLTLALKNSGVTAGTFGLKSSVTLGCVWTSNNGGVSSSTAQTTLTAKQACTVSFDYSYSSEANYDKFTLTVGTATVENAVSGATTNKSYSGSVASGGAIVFKYAKDGSQNKNDDRCTFSNFTVQIGSGAPVQLNSQNIGAYFTVADGTYKFVPQDYLKGGTVTAPEFTVDEKGRITRAEDAVLRLSGSCTIPASGWASDGTSGFPYYYDLPVEGVTAEERADILIPPAGLSAASACGLCPATETLDGKIRVRAVRIPTTAITAEYRISKV